MLNTQNPLKGRSRFSKALPVPPPEISPPKGRQLSDTLASPVNSTSSSQRALPLPPSLQVKMPSTVVIPRRPVGTQAVSEVSSGSASSVYSDSPGTAPKLVDGDNFSVASPSKELVEKYNGNMQPLPAPPIDKESMENELPKIPNHSYSNSTSSNGSSSSRPEIWRRRSVRSDRSIPITDLKLSKSNGYTQVQPVISHSSPPPDHPLPSIPIPPRSISGLPGKNIRKPIPARPAPPQPDKMGADLSKLKSKKLQSPDLPPSVPVHQKQPPSPVKRLPTPEYEQSEKPHPPTPQVISPVAPQTPPQEAIVSTVLPPRTTSLGENSLLRKPPSAAAGLPNSPRPSKLNELKSPESTVNVGSSPSLVASQPQKGNTPKILTPEPSPLPSPPAKVTQTSTPIPAETSTPIPPPKSIARQPVPLPANPAPAPATATATAPTPTPAPITGPAQAPFLHPTTQPSDTVLRAGPLSINQLECYQSHRSMRISRNDICPLACGVCESKDRDRRWMCNWCSLRCCGPCVKALKDRQGGDLKAHLKSIGKSDRIAAAMPVMSLLAAR